MGLGGGGGGGGRGIQLEGDYHIQFLSMGLLSYLT